VLSVAAFLISIVSTKPATTVTRTYAAVFTIPPHAAMKIFEFWSQGVSKNKNSFTLIRHSLCYNDLTLWQEALEQGVINVAK
jgi:hypothetical protein